MSTGSPTVRRRRLGNQLRLARQDSGMTVAVAAHVLGVSQSTLTRVERGHVGVRARDLEAMLDLYRVGDRAALLELGSGGWREEGWWSPYNAYLSKGYATYIGFETEASEIREWESRLIPGHLQIEGYTRALMTAIPDVVPPDHVEPLLKVRKIRRDLLAERGVAASVVLDEAVLRRVVGDQDVMADQLFHLAEAAEDPRITIRVVPFSEGTAASAFQGFVVMGYDDGLQVVWSESVTGDSSIEEDNPDTCIAAFDRLQSAALSPEASRDLIQRALIRATLKGV